MLTFTEKGFLIPNKQIPSSINELEAEFVTAINSNTRKELFDLYLKYSSDLKTVCNGAEIRQWVNGSFATKKANPRDIDFVSFIDYKLIGDNEDIFGRFRNPDSVKQYSVDAYVVIEYPEDHKNHNRFLGDKLYWRDHFDKTEPNIRGVKWPKGFLEILY